MTKIYSLHCILTIDHRKKENLIVSSNKEKIEFPIFEIQHPRFLTNELRYHIQQILLDNTYNKDVIKDMSFSYTDIQNELILKYIEDTYQSQFDLDKDIFVFCAAIMENAYPLNNFDWFKFDFVKSISGMNVTNAIIDFTIQKSIL